MTEARLQKGFTLLEVMVAFVLLTMTVVGTSLIYQVGFRSQLEAEQQLQGVFWAQDRLETVKAIPFDQLTLMKDHPEDPAYIPAGYPADLWEDTQDGYHRQLELSGNGLDIIVIRVTVSWNEGSDNYVLAGQVASN